MAATLTGPADTVRRDEGKELWSSQARAQKHHELLEQPTPETQNHLCTVLLQEPIVTILIGFSVCCS